MARPMTGGKVSKLSDGGRKDKGTGKAKKNIVGAKPPVYGNSNYSPPENQYRGVPIQDAPPEEQKRRLEKYGPYLGAAGLATAASFANLLYQQGAGRSKDLKGK